MIDTLAPIGHSPQWKDGSRTAPPAVGDERAVLTSFLEWHRETFEVTCTGIPPDRLSERAVPPSSPSLHGLLRHSAGVERWWFRLQVAGKDVPVLHRSDDGAVGAFAGWRRERRRSREIVATAA